MHVSSALQVCLILKLFPTYSSRMRAFTSMLCAIHQSCPLAALAPAFFLPTLNVSSEAAADRLHASQAPRTTKNLEGTGGLPADPALRAPSVAQWNDGPPPVGLPQGYTAGAVLGDMAARVGYLRLNLLRWPGQYDVTLDYRQPSDERFMHLVARLDCLCKVLRTIDHHNAERTSRPVKRIHVAGCTVQQEQVPVGLRMLNWVRLDFALVLASFP
jgi:hypothetical protein